MCHRQLYKNLSFSLASFHFSFVKIKLISRHYLIRYVDTFLHKQGLAVAKSTPNCTYGSFIQENTDNYIIGVGTQNECFETI